MNFLQIKLKYILQFAFLFNFVFLTYLKKCQLRYVFLFTRKASQMMCHSRCVCPITGTANQMVHHLRHACSNTATASQILPHLCAKVLSTSNRRLLNYNHTQWFCLFRTVTDPSTIPYT